jgi:hypothetical protein
MLPLLMLMLFHTFSKNIFLQFLIEYIHPSFARTFPLSKNPIPHSFSAGTLSHKAKQQQQQQVTVDCQLSERNSFIVSFNNIFVSIFGSCPEAIFAPFRKSKYIIPHIPKQQKKSTEKKTCITYSFLHHCPQMEPLQICSFHSANQMPKKFPSSRYSQFALNDDDDEDENMRPATPESAIEDDHYDYDAGSYRMDIQDEEEEEEEEDMNSNLAMTICCQHMNPTAETPFC